MAKKLPACKKKLYLRYYFMALWSWQWASIHKLLSAFHQHLYSICARFFPAGILQREADNGLMCALSGPIAARWKPAIILGIQPFFCHLQMNWSNNPPPQQASITMGLVGGLPVASWLARDLPLLALSTWVCYNHVGQNKLLTQLQKRHLLMQNI